MIGKRKPPTQVPRRRRDDDDAGEKSLQESYSPVYFRNRTMTGSLSSDVRAASEQSGSLQSDRSRMHALARLRSRIITIGLVALLVSLLVAGFMWQFIGKVTIHGANARVDDQSRYEEIIDDYFEMRPLERFRFAINMDALNSYMALHAGEVHSIASITASDIIESDFILKMREPIVGWAIDDRQYYVDSDGMTFELSYFGRPAVQIDDQTGVTPESGQAIASNRFLGYVGRIIAETQKLSYKVTEVIIPPGTTRQVEMKLEGQPFVVKLSIDRGVAVQVEDMDRAIKYLASQNRKTEIIDVRVENRAYYR